jgi:hypothetical protein
MKQIEPVPVLMQSIRVISQFTYRHFHSSHHFSI